MTRPKIYPEVRALLESIEAEGAPAIETLSPAEARQAAIEGLRLLAGEPEEIGRVENLQIQGPQRSIPIRVFTPAGPGPFPGLVYFHGGGWVVCDLDTHDVACRAIARRAGAVVVAVDYALSWGLENIAARVTTLAERLRERLGAADGVRVHDQGRRRCGIVTFTVDGVAADDVQRQLAARGVNTHVSHAESAQFDLPHRGLTTLVRASVHYYNNDAELDRLVGALPEPRPGQPAGTAAS